MSKEQSEHNENAASKALPSSSGSISELLDQVQQKNEPYITRGNALFEAIKNDCPTVKEFTERDGK